MRNFENNAMMQEMSLQEMKDVNGGLIGILACLFVGGLSISMCSDNHISVGHGTGNNVAVGDSIQNK